MEKRTAFAHSFDDLSEWLWRQIRMEASHDVFFRQTICWHFAAGVRISQSSVWTAMGAHGFLHARAGRCKCIESFGHLPIWSLRPETVSCARMIEMSEFQNFGFRRPSRTRGPSFARPPPAVRTSSDNSCRARE